jgi:hypothetical protein
VDPHSTNESTDYPDYISVLSKINEETSADSGYEDNDEPFNVPAGSVLVNEYTNIETGVIVRTWKPPQLCCILGALDESELNLKVQNALSDCQIPPTLVNNLEIISKNEIRMFFPSQYTKNVTKTKLKKYFYRCFPTTIIVL